MCGLRTLDNDRAGGDTLQLIVTGHCVVGRAVVVWRTSAGQLGKGSAMPGRSSPASTARTSPTDVFPAGGIGQLQVRLDPVAVAAPLLLLNHVAGLDRPGSKDSG
jgi:hypothetical protein